MSDDSRAPVEVTPEGRPENDHEEAMKASLFKACTRASRASTYANKRLGAKGNRKQKEVEKSPFARDRPRAHQGALRSPHFSIGLQANHHIVVGKKRPAGAKLVNEASGATTTGGGGGLPQ
ncbi:hypothetical protein N7470_009905 [Penicillium chermesinum]|nr:hypothetical protein N7470_009905 [Penicillium chermesinum]